ncbi:PREDICTED: sedoheptulokinase-like [Amphimedon queenslandica]|uniref:Carbohydrate kinase FGGY N-terminal domain-containing protein n=1 Tax=Amphimedon queenslandica TaxID=400682 RepID=A0A1X7TKN1_AMPQE|nr:PREDICTED: sedoheptulokinase-like [Amphimedon queenslandica]|eukprot:XP_019859031.1 PREDICTED: sedoheptulokinase-like [Amphimedon queenslandica]
MAVSELILGIDIGTSTVKGTLVDKESREVVEKQSEPTLAQISSQSSGRGVEKDEQDVLSIVKAMELLMSRFSSHNLKRVKGIGISGQMHGVVLWRNGGIKLENGRIIVTQKDSVSSLVTWQDGRCSKNFLLTLPKTNQPIPLSTGYGCATLFWYSRASDAEGTLSLYDRTGTIMDCFVSVLCGSTEVIMSSQNANSWGYFDVKNNTWEYDILRDGSFPVHLLPRVVSAPSIVGSLVSEWCGVPPGVLVAVAMGDLQCSVSAVKPLPTNAILSIGTSSQLSVINNCISFDGSLPSSIMEVPYFNNKTLLVAAALTGGNVIARLVDFLKEFLRGIHIPDSAVDTNSIYSFLIKSANEKRNTSLQVSPLILGERHAPTLRGSVSNISSDNISVGDVSSAVMRGIVDNLKEMMPLALLQQFKVDTLIGSGSCLDKNPVLAQLIVEGFGYPLELRSNVDAPYGAAMAVLEIT